MTIQEQIDPFQLSLTIGALQSLLDDGVEEEAEHERQAWINILRHEAENLLTIARSIENGDYIE
jgi:hypothetical protein